MKSIALCLLVVIILGHFSLEAKIPLPTKNQLRELQLAPYSRDKVLRYWELADNIKTNAYGVTDTELEWITFQILTNSFSQLDYQTGKGLIGGYDRAVSYLQKPESQWKAYCEIADVMAKINVISTNVYMRELTEAVELDRPGLEERSGLPYEQKYPHGAAWRAKWRDEIKRNDERRRIRGKLFGYLKMQVANYAGIYCDEENLPICISNIAERAKMMPSEQQEMLGRAVDYWRWRHSK